MATSSVRLDQELIEKATIMAKAYNRTPPKQIEHWSHVGKIAEENPDLPYALIKDILRARTEEADEEYTFD